MAIDGTWSVHWWTEEVKSPKREWRRKSSRATRCCNAWDRLHWIQRSYSGLDAGWDDTGQWWLDRMIPSPHGFRCNAKTTKHVRICTYICMYLQELRNTFKRLALTSSLFRIRLVTTLFAWLHSTYVQYPSIEIGSRRKGLRVTKHDLPLLTNTEAAPGSWMYCIVGMNVISFHQEKRWGMHIAKCRTSCAGMGESSPRWSPEHKRSTRSRAVCRHTRRVEACVSLQKSFIPLRVHMHLEKCCILPRTNLHAHDAKTRHTLTSALSYLLLLHICPPHSSFPNSLFSFFFPLHRQSTNPP